MERADRHEGEIHREKCEGEEEDEEREMEEEDEEEDRDEKVLLSFNAIAAAPD